MAKSLLSISIVLSTYNGEKNILEQLNSLLHQIRVPEEVLIFDDCSSDSTVEIVRDFILENNLFNWKLIINNNNKGWKKNFIDGMNAASGELIFPCDQDDIWHDNKLEKMEKIMSEHDEINVLVSNYIEFYESSGKQIVQPTADTGIIHAIPIKKRFMNIEYPGCVYCVRKQFFEKIIKYWDEMIPHDSLIWRMGMFSNSLYAFDTSLIIQRKHFDSTFSIEAKNSKSLEAKKNEVIYTKVVIQSIKNFLNDNNLANENSNYILSKALCWTEKRNIFFETKNIFAWIALLKYLKYYQTNKKYLLDLYVAIMK